MNLLKNNMRWSWEKEWGESELALGPLQSSVKRRKLEETLVLIPTYNDKENISALLREIRHMAEKCEILAVDDNSPDGTACVVQKLADESDRIHIICRKDKRGYGRELIEGFRYGLTENFGYFIIMNADLSHNPKDVPRLLEKIQHHDIVIGSRYVRGGQIIADCGIFRRTVSEGVSWLTRRMLNLSVKDCTSGYRYYSRKIIENLELDKITSKGYAFLIELLHACYKKGYNIAEIPITYIDREQGKLKLSKKIVLGALLQVFKLGWRIR